MSKPKCKTCDDTGEVQVDICQAGDQTMTEWHACPDCDATEGVIDLMVALQKSLREHGKKKP